MISPANAGPGTKVGGGATRENQNLDQNSNKSQEPPISSTIPSERLESRSAGQFESTPWHIPEPRPQPSWNSQPLLSGWHPLNLSRLHYPRELLVNPRLDLATPFLPGMTGGFLPHMLDRFPALPVPSPVPLSSPFPGLLASQQSEKHKRKRSPSPEQEESKNHPSPTNRSLKARILCRSPEFDSKETVKSSTPAIDPVTTLRPSSIPKSTCASSSSGAGFRPGHPAHFNHGTLIQLADGSMKRVEDLVTEDFLQSAESSQDVRIDQSTVVKLEKTTSDSESILITFSVGRSRVQVTVEAAMEHPFYVFERGWSSYSPELTLARYELQCQQLKVGDTCISLTHKVSTTSSSPSSFLMPPPQEESLLPVRESKYSPKQVGFNETPSIYRINTDSPPNKREYSASPSPPQTNPQSLKSEPLSETEDTDTPSNLVQPSKSSIDPLVSRS